MMFHDMEDFLGSLGMTDAFEQIMADFPGMSSGGELFLSKVTHKSFVEVNEEGTEAAASTRAIMMFECARITSWSLLTTTSFSLFSTAKAMVFCSVANSASLKGMVSIVCSHSSVSYLPTLPLTLHNVSEIQSNLW